MWLPGSLAALVHDHHIESAPPGQIEQQKEAPAPVPEPPSPPAPTQPADEKPSGDPHVCMAFATGWQMTEVYKSARRIEDGAKAPLGPPPEDTGLHCLRQLDAVDRATLAVEEIQVALFKLRGRFAAAAIDPPDLTPLRQALAASGDDRSSLIDAVRSKHDEMLRRLIAADYRLGKAYRLGVELGETTVAPESHEKVDMAFGSRAVSIRTSLADLASVLPPHASRSVAISLRTWEMWAADPEINGKRVCDANWAAVRASLRRQGELWRSLLSGEKCGEDMLSMTDYVRAANGLVAKAGRTILQFTRRWVIAAMFMVALVVLAIVAALIAPSGASKALTALAALAAAVGVTGAGIRARASHLSKQLETRLWSAEMDEAIGRAITKGPAGWGMDVSDVNVSATGDDVRTSRQITVIRLFRAALAAGKARRVEILLAPRVYVDLGNGTPRDDAAAVLTWAKSLSPEARKAFAPNGDPVVAGYPGYFVVEGEGHADLWRVREGKISCWRRYESLDAARSAAGLANVS